MDSQWIKAKCHEPIKNKFRPVTFEYQNIEREFKTRPDWPPISASTNNLAALMRLESTSNDVTSVLDFEEGNATPTSEGQNSAPDEGYNSGKKGPGGDWEPFEKNKGPDNGDHSEISRQSSANPDSPTSTKDDKIPLLVDSWTNEKQHKPQQPILDRSVPLLNQIQDSSSLLVRQPSVDTAPLVDSGDQSQHAFPAHRETTAL